MHKVAIFILNDESLGFQDFGCASLIFVLCGVYVLLFGYIYDGFC